ncbi:MAG: hypothetical protein R6V29_12355 [Spirochaetia bacterium]
MMLYSLGMTKRVFTLGCFLCFFLGFASVATGSDEPDNGPQEDRLRLSIETVLRPEVYPSTNRAERDFRERLERENPLAQVRTSYGVDGGPQIVTSTVLEKEFRLDTPTNIPTPKDGNPAPFENNMMHAGYLEIPGDYLELVFGRQQVHIGPSPHSSIMASDRLPYLDAARLSLTLGDLRMIHLVSSLENRASEAEQEADLPGRLADETYGHEDQYAYGKNMIFYNVHYFEYAWDRLRLGIAGQMLVSRPMNEFHLADFFPVFSWHNADIVPHNMAMVIDGSFMAAPGLELYAQVGWDDVSAETFGVADSDLPTIPAYIGGLRYERETNGLRLGGTLEGGYTHYLWGNFYEEFALSRAIYRQNVDGGRRSMALTSPYGPGVLWSLLRVGADFDSGFDLEAEYHVRSENTRANLYDTPYESTGRVANAPRRVLHRIALHPTYHIGSGVELRAEPALLVDGGEIGFEASVGMTYRYSTTSRPGHTDSTDQ